MRRPAATALVWPAVILAAVSIGLAAGPLPWRFAGESGLPPPAPAPGPAAPDPVSLASILRLSPFGRLVRPSAEALPAEETTLGLTLHGVVIAALPGASSAIVSSEAEPARVYLVGEAITNSATLEAVFSDHVVLRVEGNPETLSFPKPGSLPVGGVDAPRPDDAAEGAEAEDNTQEPEGDIETVIESYRQRIQDDPEAVLDDLGLVATDDGYQVDSEAPDSVLAVGFLPGDVVAKVNGQQVGNIEQDRQLFDEVAASGHARIEFLRQGQSIVLSLPLK